MFPEGNDIVLFKGACSQCGSSDGNAHYEDGHTYCYVCRHRGAHSANDPGGVDQGPGRERPLPGGSVPRDRDPGALPVSLSETRPLAATRGLTEATLKRYGYRAGTFKGRPVHVAQYHDQDGEPVAQHLRYADKKDFAWLGPKGVSPSTFRLFGHHVYGDRFDRTVVITTGEIDAMSVAQEMDFKIAAVSIGNGDGSAAKSLKANYLWLDRFAEIILWFDDDEFGREALAECASLFRVGKVRVAKAPGGQGVSPAKDANDLLQQNRPGDIKSAIYMATAWRPAGIVNAADRVEDVLAPREGDAAGWSYDWPWPQVQEALGPIQPGQVCYHVAGTGIGKTTAVAEIEMHLLAQGARVAHMGFEDTRRDVKLRLLSIQASKRLDLEPMPEADMRALHEEVFGRRCLELFDPETAEWSVEAILGYVRYCAKALDCRVIFLDPLSFIAAGLSQGEDERRALDKASRDLAAMAKELGVHLQITHHLRRPEGTAHEEGATTSLNEVRGSGGIANFATFVIGHERNQQAEGDHALVTRLRSLKNRVRSKTGPLLNLIYGLATGRLLPTDLQFPASGSKGRHGGSFGPASTNSTDY